MKTRSSTSSAKHTTQTAVLEVNTPAPIEADSPVVEEAVAPLAAPFALQKRAMLFAIGVRGFVEKLPKQLALSDDAAQLVRASGNVGMYSIEADEAPSKKAFTLHMSRCKKEIKEVLYWLQLLDRSLMGYTEKRRQELYKEAHELRRIFTAIVKTSIQNG